MFIVFILGHQHPVTVSFFKGVNEEIPISYS